MNKSTLFLQFKRDIQDIAIPDKFTFPFYYEAHPLAVLAAKELQENYLINHSWDHNFGLSDQEKGLVIGKMFGVLVVRKNSGELGYLCAFSGKLANENHHYPFVPPVYDLLDKNGFFLDQEQELNALNQQIEQLEISEELEKLNVQFVKLQLETNEKINAFKAKIQLNKNKRKDIRTTQKIVLDQNAFDILNHELNQQSIEEQYQLKHLVKREKERINVVQDELFTFKLKIEALKQLRASKSAALQEKIFKQYDFLNGLHEKKNLVEIFKTSAFQNPPAGAGECAAPKLLQYAFLHGFKPIVMAEFWWGKSPSSEIRKHMQFYPACKGKCEPILGHMLKGISVEENPLLKNPALNRNFDIHYEDESIIVVNKPHEFLSVPGKTIEDSIYTRIKAMYPQATGPLLVHRLDMSTSGLLLIAKNKEAHYYLQKQFIGRKVEKYYEALLETCLLENEGVIELPLRLDINDRPKQMVCYQYGKHALTEWKKLENRGDKCLVRLKPITGRTHQLRVHCAHLKGLNTPIEGDDLYGTKSERLYLHAAFLKFRHPETKEPISFYLPSKF